MISGYLYHKFCGPMLYFRKQDIHLDSRLKCINFTLEIKDDSPYIPRFKKIFSDSFEKKCIRMFYLEFISLHFVYQLILRKPCLIRKI
jgi:hypothetical protein